MNAKNSKKITVLLATALLLVQTSILKAESDPFGSWYNEQKAILAQAKSAEPAEQIDLLGLVTEACIQKANDASLTLDQQALIKLLEHDTSYIKADWGACWQEYDLYLGLLAEAHDADYAAGVVVRNGRILYSYKRFEDCEEMFTAGLQRFSGSSLAPEISLLLGKTLYKLEDYANSKARFEKLIVDFPESKFVPDALFGLAQSMIRNHEYAQAHNVLDDLIKNHPKSKAAQHALIRKGDIHLGYHQWAEAILCYQEFFNRYPGSWYSPYARRQLERAEDDMLNSLSEEIFE